MRAGRLFLDSADLDLARAAAASGVIAGITTNPAIMHKQAAHGPQHFGALLSEFTCGPVFYQLTARTPDTARAELAEVDQAAAGSVDRVVIKLPAQPWLYSLAASLTSEGREVAFTAVYDPGQVLCAVDTGARWIIPYVDRAARLDGDKGPVVPRLAAHVPDGVALLAASIKCAEQALSALGDGADGVTTTWPVIQSLMSHPLTDSAVEEFLTLQHR